MSKRLHANMSDQSAFKEKSEPLTDIEKQKVESLSADIETHNNKKLVVRCLMVAALFMCLLQSGQIVRLVEDFSPNFFSDSAKVVSRQWHQGMKVIGLADIKDRMSEKIQNVLPELDPKNRSLHVQIEGLDGSTFSIRGSALTNKNEQDLVLAEKEPRSDTIFGKHNFRGSL